MAVASGTSPVVGHAPVLDRFARWLAADRIAGAYLLTGPEGIGKYTAARYIAQCLLCEGTPRDELQACGECAACHQVRADTHPDLLEVRRAKGKNELSIELFAGPRENRMREGLCYDLAIRPFRGGRRVAIIDEAEYLNQESANCLLKTLEEPPSHAVIILIAPSEFGQLPTIRSRCQVVRFLPLAAGEVATLLERLEVGEDDRQRHELGLASGGNLRMALELNSDETRLFRQALLRRLATLDPTDDDFANVVNNYVDAAGNDAADRRDRLRLVLDVAVAFYRQVMLGIGDMAEPVDRDMTEGLRTALANWRGDASTAARCIERCMEARNDVSANANQALLIESWLAELGTLMRREGR